MTPVGEQPAPRTDPADPPPGGVDAVVSVEYEVGAVVPDLAPGAHADDPDPDELDGD